VVATAKKEGLRLIVVILGSPKARRRDAAAMEKFRKYFAEYAMTSVITKGQVIDREIFLPQGETPRLKGVAAAAFHYPVAKNKRDSIMTDIHLPAEIEGIVKKGQKLGEVSIRIDGDTVGAVDIVSPVNVPKAGLWTRILRFLKSYWIRILRYFKIY
jgi:D-alanyl-D-alanine carboxypeptidase (penicillin-binding protein 5/6)